MLLAIVGGAGSTHSAMPRNAFFGPAESVPAAEAIDHIATEQLTPDPPGVPAIAPGERITAQLVKYLRRAVAMVPAGRHRSLVEDVPGDR